MSKKYNIVIPTTIYIDPPPGQSSNKIPVPFVDWIRNSRLMDSKVGKTLASLYSGVDMRNSIEDKEEGDDWVLEENEYNILLDVIENPSNPYEPFVAYQLQPYFEAVRDAEIVK